ncbi:alpha-amylase family glycosyl hydrolase [Alkalihalobacterium bogoriense]|uniref:alpha-amylase family glycosyl hydrolase n=1 Tax=Alkalihalobacterium bogoriense TaxID=246272 RepID=UPI000686E36B|nr:alpha-amylase family glycosyl hydrolase [Alkalihalobacterium bogoriense]
MFTKHRKWYSLALALLMVFSVFTSYLPATASAQSDPELKSPVVESNGSVTFNYSNNDAQRVRIAGSFTEWQSNALNMEKQDGVWTKTTELTPDVYEYKFIVGDDGWINDPLNPQSQGGNSKLVVPGLKLGQVSTTMQVGRSYELKADFVNEVGETSGAEGVTWSLVSAPTGVELTGSTLTIGSDVAANREVKVKAAKDNYETVKTVKTVGVMYEYTINYHRLDNNLDGWNLWIYNSGSQDAGYTFTNVHGEENYKFAKGTFSFPENDITALPRKSVGGNDWASQDEPGRLLAIPNGETSSEFWIVEGKSTVYTSEAAAKAAIDEINGNVRPHIRFTYERPDQDYTNWDVWVWGTGARNDNIDFTRFEDGKAIAEIFVGPQAERVGFIVRTAGWDSREPGGDRTIHVSKSDPITKVHVKSGETEFFTVPSISKPTITNGNATFQFRDKDLYLADKMDQIEKVELAFDFDGTEEKFEMTNEVKNERFVYTFTDFPSGEFEYYFYVTVDGVTSKVSDPYNTVNGKSVVSYFSSELDVAAEVTPAAVDYNQNAVVTLDITSEEEVELREIFVDLREVGGNEKVAIDTELQELTIAVDHKTTAGVKTLPITVVDVYGNEHYGEAEVTVQARHSIGEGDFDWDEARIYFLLTDRFFDGDSSNNDPYGVGYDTSMPGAYKGGDFKGITERLDYLDALGINTIWINPIVENIVYDVRHADDPHITPYYGYHGYWASNFEELNPHFGTMEDFHELIDEAHARGMKLMIDVVLNHTGYGLKEADARLDGTIPHFPTNEDRARFAGMLRDGGSDEVRGELAGLPDFITEDPAVRDQIVQWQVDWIEKSRTPNGNTIDYFRVDTVKHVEDATWMKFKNEQTKVMPEFKMIGESWGAHYNDDHGYLNTGMMDSLLDFDFKNYAVNFANGQINSVENTMRARNEVISNGGTLGQFLGSHDEIGFLDQPRIAGDTGKLKLGAALQITAKGQPVIYYGEELGYSGEANYPHYTNRYVIDWNIVEGNDIHEHYTKLLNARKAYSQVFSKGTRQQIAGSDAEGYTAFERKYQDESVVVAINVGTEAKEVTFTVPFASGNTVTDVYGNHTYTVADDQTVTVTLPGRDAGGTVILANGVVQDPVDGTDPVDPTNPTNPTNPNPSPTQPTQPGDKDSDKGSDKDKDKDKNKGKDKEKSPVVPVPSETTKGKVDKKTGTVTIDTKPVQKLPTNGVLEIDLKDANKLTVITVKLTSEQVKELRSKNATISIKKDDVTIGFPANNLPGDGEVEFIIEKYQDYKGALSAVYDFTVKQEGKKISNFEFPVTLTFKVDASKVKNPDNVKVYYYNEETGKWELIGGVYKDGYVTAETTHFSLFTVFEREQVESEFSAPAPEQVKEGKALPKTATNLFNGLVLGTILLLVGIGFYIYRRKKQIV